MTHYLKGRASPHDRVVATSHKLLDFLRRSAQRRFTARELAYEIGMAVTTANITHVRHTAETLVAAGKLLGHPPLKRRDGTRYELPLGGNDEHRC